MVSPVEAVRVSGENLRPPLPTSISWAVPLVLELEEAELMVVVIVEVEDAAAASPCWTMANRVVTRRERARRGIWPSIVVVGLVGLVGLSWYGKVEALEMRWDGAVVIV